MSEVYKCLNGLSTDMNGILAVSKQRYNIRHYNIFVTDRAKNDRYGRNSIPYGANQIWDLLSRPVKKITTLVFFKINSRHCLECSFTFCKTYLVNLRYLQGRSVLASCYFLFIRR